MKYVKLFEEHDSLKEQIKEYLNTEYTEDWFNVKFQERVFDYITEDDLIGYGDPDDESTWDYENEEEAYQNLSTGCAIEYDLAEEIRKDICKKFNISNDDYFDKLRIDNIVTDHIKDNANWCDPSFGRSVSDILGRTIDTSHWDDLM